MQVFRWIDAPSATLVGEELVTVISALSHYMGAADNPTTLKRTDKVLQRLKRAIPDGN